MQSAVTTRIRKLEGGLGVLLFRRHARGVALTAPGEALLPFARQITHLLAEARQAVVDGDTPKGRLLLGAMETTAALRLGTKLAAFATRYPAVELTLRTGTTAEMIGQVLHQELEAAFICGPVAHPQLLVQPVFQERLVAVAAPGVPDLAAATASGRVRILVLRRGCSYRQRLEDLLARRGVAVVQVLEYGTFDAILACVSAGMGLTLLPAALLDQWAARHAVSALAVAGAGGRGRDGAGPPCPGLRVRRDAGVPGRGGGGRGGASADGGRMTRQVTRRTGMRTARRTVAQGQLHRQPGHAWRG